MVFRIVPTPNMASIDPYPSFSELFRAAVFHRFVLSTGMALNLLDEKPVITTKYVPFLSFCAHASLDPGNPQYPIEVLKYGYSS
ncbi:unnamed protein product [Enterobius vermicularis]|uniref:HORMA domain-containing protein n=1 Tax=Enterobius vermicularis TaxID=51028 RepID=A0A0N4VLS0_ENTVE|nr:unnamed protein product [Enterobius vermicularis]